MIHTLTREQAAGFSTHDFVWQALLRTGEIIWEQPGVSSDHLPAEEVVQIAYVPTRRPDLPIVETAIDLGRGERFVRYWTTIWKPGNKGTQFLYVVGVKSKDQRYALLCYYVRFNKVVLAASCPFQASWLPEPFRLLPSAATIIGGPGTSRFGWRHEGYGGVVEVWPDRRLTFHAVYQ